MAGITTITHKKPGVTAEQVSALCGWPALDGFVIVGLPLDEQDKEIKLACDTQDLRQVHALLFAVVEKLGRAIS